MSAFQQKSTLTTRARIYRAQMLVTGEPAYKIVKFSVGSGGFDPLDNSAALAPDPQATGLQSEIFDNEYDAVEWINSFTPVFVCRLEQGEAVGQIGEIALWGEILSGPEAGEIFLVSLTHIPLYNKSTTDARTFRIVLPN